MYAVYTNDCYYYQYAALFIQFTHNQFLDVNVMFIFREFIGVYLSKFLLLYYCISSHTITIIIGNDIKMTENRIRRNSLIAGIIYDNFDFSICTNNINLLNKHTHTCRRACV